MRITKEFIVVILLIILVNIMFVSAITGTMGNAKMILYPEVNGFTTTKIEKSILTKNVNDIPINVTLKIDEGGKEFLELIDKSFILPAGEEKKAEFLVKVRKEGTYNGKINVFFSPVEGKEPGVVLSSTIIVIAKKDQGYNEIEEDSNNEEIEDNGSGVNVFVGNVVSNPENETEKNSVFWKGLLIGSSFILITVFVGLSYFTLKQKNKKIKRKKSGGNKKNKRRKK